MMAEQPRRNLLAALTVLSRIHPEWRLGQMLANLAMTAGRVEVSGVWDLEDEEALEAANTLLEQEPEALCDIETKVATAVGCEHQSYFKAATNLPGTSVGREPRLAQPRVTKESDAMG